MIIKIRFTEYDNETGNAKQIAREIEQRALTNARCKAIMNHLTNSSRTWGTGTEQAKMNAYYTGKHEQAQSMIETMIQASEEYDRTAAAKEIAKIIAMNNTNRYINKTLGIRPKRPTWYD